MALTEDSRRPASCLRAIPGEQGQKRAEEESRGAGERHTKSQRLKKKNKSLWEG